MAAVGVDSKLLSNRSIFILMNLNAVVVLVKLVLVVVVPSGGFCVDRRLTD